MRSLDYWQVEKALFHLVVVEVSNSAYIDKSEIFQISYQSFIIHLSFKHAFDLLPD